MAKKEVVKEQKKVVKETKKTVPTKTSKKKSK
jgi:hypothetical protein